MPITDITDEAVEIRLSKPKRAKATFQKLTKDDIKEILNNHNSGIAELSNKQLQALQKILDHIEGKIDIKTYMKPAENKPIEPIEEVTPKEFKQEPAEIKPEITPKEITPKEVKPEVRPAVTPKEVTPKEVRQYKPTPTKLSFASNRKITPITFSQPIRDTRAVMRPRGKNNGPSF